MKTFALAAGAAALLLTAGAAEAGTKSKSHRSSASVAGPAQPIPYAMLDDYLAASPKERASRDWWSGGSMAATTGSTSNTAATTSAESTTATPSTATGTTSDTSGGSAGQVNTPTDAGAGSSAPADTSSPKTTP